jgi:hypothetical protein
VVLVALAALTGAAPAAAQEACTAPEITAFTVGSDEPADQTRVGVPAFILPRVSGAAARIEITWPQRDVSILRPGAPAVRTFRRAGRVELAAVAVAPCGARSGVARLRIRVWPRCDEARDRSLGAYECAGEASDLAVHAGGLTTGSNLLSPFECRDVPPQPTHVPVARAAACVAPPPGPPPVPGHVPIRAGGELELHLGAPARSLVVRLGDVRGPRVRLRGIRRRSGTFRREWVVPLPRSLAGVTRVYVTARRAVGTYRWVAGVRPERLT